MLGMEKCWQSLPKSLEFQTHTGGITSNTLSRVPGLSLARPSSSPGAAPCWTFWAEPCWLLPVLEKNKCPSTRPWAAPAAVRRAALKNMFESDPYSSGLQQKLSKKLLPAFSAAPAKKTEGVREVVNHRGKELLTLFSFFHQADL